MGTLTTHGYNIISDGTRGGEFCPLINANWERHNIHEHDGANSKKIKTSNLDRGIIDLDFSNWVDNGVDYAQTVSLPSGYLYDKSNISFIAMSGANLGAKLNLRVERASAISFTVYCSFNDINVRAIIV